MTARAFFFTKIQDSASGADYERWAAEVDYPFTRRQDSVERYEIMRVRPAGYRQTLVPYEYAELIEVGDQDAFPRVFEQEEAKPIIKELGSFITPDPLGLVGTQVLALPGDNERSPARGVIAVSLMPGIERADYETLVQSEAAEGLINDPEISRVELVAIDGRYKRPEEAPFDYLAILDIEGAIFDAGVLPEAAQALLNPDLTHSAGSFALIGALIEHLAAPTA